LDKRSNWNLEFNYKPNLKLYLLYIDLNMVDFNLTIKDDIHGLVAKLWFDNEQDINTFDIL